MSSGPDNIKQNLFKEIPDSQNVEKTVKENLGNNKLINNFFKANKIDEVKSLLEQNVSDIIKENNGNFDDEFNINKIKDDLFEQYDDEQNINNEQDKKSEHTEIYNEDGSYNKETIKNIAAGMTLDELAEYTGAEIQELEKGGRELVFDGYHIAEFPTSESNKAKQNSRDFKQEIFNDDGSINPYTAGELFESGEMSLDDFIGACGFNSKDSSEISLDRSGNFNFILEDGTEVKGNIGWNMLEPGLQSIYISTPEGNEYNYEYNSYQNKY